MCLSNDQNRPLSKSAQKNFKKMQTIKSTEIPFLIHIGKGK